MHALIKISINLVIKTNFRSAENGGSTAHDNTPASPSIAGGSNSSTPDEQNQKERQQSLDSEEQSQDDIENLPEMENLRV